MKNLQFSALHVGDLHGRIYHFERAIEMFERDKLDKIVFMGDYVDSFNCTNIEIKYLLEQVISYKKKNPNKVICLLGNHDQQYIHSPAYRCSGFRAELQPDLYKLFRDNREMFQVAWLNGNYMCTHAGILSDWLYRYNDRLSYYEEKLGIDKRNNLDVLLNAINDSHDEWILNTVPTIRGGVAGSIGGIMWADTSEIKKDGCVHRFNHIVGHNQVNDIEIYQHKGGPTVIFTDCLSKSDNFFILKD